MDRKTVIALIVGVALMFMWPMLVQKIYPPVPRPISTNSLATATNPPSIAAPQGTNTNTAVPAPATVASATTNAAQAVVPPGTPEEIKILETADAIYTFTSQGGGVKNVQLKHFTETLRKKGSAVVASNELVTMNEHGRSAILAMQADGALGDNVFKLTATETNTLIAEKMLPSGLRVVKQFEPGSNYAMRVRVWLENTSGQVISLPPQSISIGSASRTSAAEQPISSGMFWYNGSKAEHIQQAWFENKTLGCFGGTPRPEYDSGVNPVQWAAVHNQFFTLVVLPATNALASQFKGTRVVLPLPPGEKLAPSSFEGTLYYPATNIASKAFVDRQFTIYTGPKQERTLTRLGRDADAVMDFGFFSPISKVFLRAMNFLSRFMPYGLALIVITIIIKLLFWPLTQASTRSMKRMQALQPEIKKLQEKYKEDPAKQQKKMMELWREHKVNPMSGCWPMLIQLPIFFALFRMIPNAIELRGTPFLWAHDLSRPDTLFYIPGLDWPFNPLPLIMGVTMLIQARMTPMSPGMDPAQQKLMKYMPLMFMVFLYGQPSGLTLYWTVQNVLTIIQTKLTKAKEEKKAVTPVVPLKKK
jgi:YidC/Oxa1 family membrane protein insertase